MGAMAYINFEKSGAGKRLTCKPAAVRTAVKNGNAVSPADVAGLAAVESAHAGTTAAPPLGAFPLDPTESILFALAQAVEQRDSQTAGHCERLAFMSVAVGMAIGLDKPQLLTLYRGGFLHDLGKVGIPDSILYKPGKLTAEEWVIMRSHTTRGEEICRPLTSLKPVLPIIRHHHERWDGTGYPDGLRGDQIPLLARITQVADIYDALISARPYKPALPPGEAVRVLQEETARGWRDPEITAVFLRLHKNVVTRIADYTTTPDRNLEAMRTALVGLDRIM